jgi:transglutaminase-like putative cysteine protease
MRIHFRRLSKAGFVVVCSMLFVSWAQAQSDEDIASAAFYAKKYKDEDVVALSSRRSFTFDKDKNDLGEKVVTIQEDAAYEFLGLKKFSSLTFFEYYNKFVELKTFRREYKYGRSYVSLQKGGIDRSVTDDGIFFDDNRVQYFNIRLNQKGAMNRVVVKKNYTDGRFLTRLYFNAAYPIREQIFEFKVPEWLTVDFKKMNFDGYKVEQEESKKGGYTNYVFRMVELPAFKSEYRRIGRAFTDPHIIIQIRSFQYKGEDIKGFDKVDDMYAWNNRFYKLAANKSDELKAQVNKLIQGKNSETEKVKAIYYWVQDNIRYIAYEDGYSGYIPTPAQEVLAKKFGDCKGMANLLTEMLKLAGIDARFSWIGTRQIPYPQSLPALCVNNHAICTVFLNGKPVFLDGTENYEPFGENAFRIQGKEVMVANGDRFDIIKVPDMSASDNRIFTQATFNLNGNALKGSVKATLTGNQRTSFHQSYQGLPSTSKKDFLKEYLEFGNDNLDVDQLKTSDLNNREMPVTIDGQVDFANSVQTISGDQYVSLDFFPKSLERFIPDEKRIEGYDLGENLTYEDEFTLQIPADRKFVDVPQNLELNNEGYSFKGEYVLQNNKLTLKKTLTIRNSIIRKSDFENWKKFINTIKEFNTYLLSVTKK